MLPAANTHDGHPQKKKPPACKPGSSFFRCNDSLHGSAEGFRFHFRIRSPDFFAVYRCVSAHFIIIFHLSCRCLFIRHRRSRSNRFDLRESARFRFRAVDAVTRCTGHLIPRNRHFLLRSFCDRKRAWCSRNSLSGHDRGVFTEVINAVDQAVRTDFIIIRRTTCDPRVCIGNF